jgi:hypothetical protein
MHHHAVQRGDSGPTHPRGRARRRPSVSDGYQARHGCIDTLIGRIAHNSAEVRLLTRRDAWVEAGPPAVARLQVPFRRPSGEVVARLFERPEPSRRLRAVTGTALTAAAHQP